MVTDVINKDWITNTDMLASSYEAGDISITDFSNDQLQWLIYWNWGYSGISLASETKVAMEELKRRNVIYRDALGKEIDILVEMYSY